MKRLFWYNFLLVVFVLQPGPEKLGAFPLAKIEFKGNSRIVSARLDKYIVEKTNPFQQNFTRYDQLLLTVQSIESNVLDLYRMEGLYEATIDSLELKLVVPTDSTQGYALMLILSEGALYTIHSISFTGNATFSAGELRNRMDTREGQILNSDVLQDDLRHLLHLYETRGFAFAVIAIDRITPNIAGSEGGLDIALHIAEGPPARIGRVLVIGNASTNADVIYRELRLSKGALYSEGDIDHARARVGRLGFFESVSEPDIYLESDSLIDLVFRIKEASTSTIDGVLGYNPPRSSTQSGYFSGIIDLSFRNIAGTGRNAALNYDREDPSSQQLSVRYLEPWIFNLPLNISGSFQQRQQDSSFVRTVGDLGATLLITDDIGIRGSLSYERVIPTDLPGLGFISYDSRTLSAGIAATYDSRENNVAPRDGIFLSFAASYGGKKIFGPARFIDTTTATNLGIRRLMFDASGFIPFASQRFVTMVGIHASSIEPIGGQLDPSDFFRLGGIYSIRGYREAELLASRYAYSNIELRLMTGTYSFVFGFVDCGYVFEDATKLNASSFMEPLSYGLGAQVESGFGIVSATIGLARGEPVDRAKLHFGLIKQF